MKPGTGNSKFRTRKPMRNPVFRSRIFSEIQRKYFAFYRNFSFTIFSSQMQGKNSGKKGKNSKFSTGQPVAKRSLLSIYGLEHNLRLKFVNPSAPAGQICHLFMFQNEYLGSRQHRNLPRVSKLCHTEFKYYMVILKLLSIPVWDKTKNMGNVNFANNTYLIPGPHHTRNINSVWHKFHLFGWVLHRIKFGKRAKM